MATISGICRALRPASGGSAGAAIRARTSPLCGMRACGRRSVSSSIRIAHAVPELENHQKFAAEGVDSLFSPAGYEMAWTEYQRVLCERLSDLTLDTTYQGKSTLDLVLSTAHSSANAQLFNHASMAWNNHFFFDSIIADPSTNQGPSESVLRHLSADFPDFEGLKSSFIAHADSMFGPGFVWLVGVRTDKKSSTFSCRIMCTYLAGSPHAGAYNRSQRMDMNSASARDGRDNESGIAAGTNEARAAIGGLAVEPLLCVNTWQHVWLRDWGVAHRLNYLNAWWDCIDWNKVERRMEGYAASASRLSSSPLGSTLRNVASPSVVSTLGSLGPSSHTSPSVPSPF